VLAGTSAGLTEEGSAMYYAQSWLLTHYFYSNSDRQAQLRRYLSAVAKEGPVRAMQSATGLNMEQFTKELARYIRGGTINYRRMQRPAAQPVPVRITALPRSAADLLVHEAQLRINAAGDPGTIGSIRAAAAKHPGDPLAQRVLAHAELLHGDRAAAEAGDKAAAEQARLWFAKAHKIDRNHFQTLYRYAQSLRSGSEGVSENTTNVLLLAHQLAPQVAEIRFNAAAILLARGDLDLAEGVLEPLLTDPHNPRGAATARKMLEEARSRSASPAAAKADQ
jgi:hypothetical protein